MQLTVFTRRNFVADFLQAKCDFRRKSTALRFWAPPSPLEGLVATYDDHLRLTGKRVVDFLLVLIELFLYVLRLRRYERISVQNWRFRSNGGRLTQNFRQMGSFPTNHSSSRKTRLNYRWYGITIWTDLSFVLSQSMRLTDGQTDRQTAFSSLDRVCNACIAVKNKHKIHKHKHKWI